MFTNFELKYYRNMGLKQRMEEKINMLAMEESEKSWKMEVLKNPNVQEFPAQVLQENGTKVENWRKF